jgi:hypothetical protein
VLKKKQRTRPKRANLPSPLFRPIWTFGEVFELFDFRFVFRSGFYIKLVLKTFWVKVVLGLRHGGSRLRRPPRRKMEARESYWLKRESDF